MTLSPTGRRVIPLFELTRADRNRAGGKAATLGELAAHGFPVPDGFVVTSTPDAHEAEDLAEASFAGQYESFPNARGGDAMLAAR